MHSVLPDLFCLELGGGEMQWRKCSLLLQKLSLGKNQPTSITSVTPLGVRTIVALAITPLVLVIDDSTTREASQVTSREWRMKIKGFAKIFVLVTRWRCWGFEEECLGKIYVLSLKSTCKTNVRTIIKDQISCKIIPEH